MVPGKPLLVMTWEGSDASLPSILLNSHTDVVPVFQDKWDRDAFDARVDEEGKIVARGAQDMKCVGIGYIEAIRRLKAAGLKPTRTVHLSFVPDEEIGGTDGMASFIGSADFKALSIGMALDEGIPSPFSKVFVFNQERVPWWFTILIKGVTGHGSGLPQGTAAEKLHAIMGSIFKFREEQTKLLQSYDGRIGEVTSINITKFSGGIQTNVIPETISISTRHCYSFRFIL
jgi:aminoacylase